VTPILHNFNSQVKSGKGLIVSQVMFRLGARAQFSGTGNEDSLLLVARELSSEEVLGNCSRARALD